MAMNIKLTKEQQQYLAAGVLGLAGFGYAYITFFWLPIAAKIKDTKAKIEQVEAKIEKATRQAARLPQLEKEIVLLNEQAIEAEKRLPKLKSTPEIFVTVASLAEKHRIGVTNFTPGAAANKQFFTELQYPMTVKGNFHSIGKFFAALALEERIFNVMNVIYGSPDGSGDMTVSFTLVSYQYKG